MTRQPTLWARFQDLRPTLDTETVAAIRCGAGNQHLLIRGEYGEPALLLSTETRTTQRVEIRLKHVGVQFDRRFEIANDEGGIEVGNFCKFTCDPASPHLHQYFVELMAASASAHPAPLSQNTTDEVVDVLLELFRKLSLPSDSSVIGLWGELLIIHLAYSPGEFVDAWHLRTSDGFDFAFPEKRIEVKSTLGASREHEFSFNQVRSGRPTDLVASITLSRSSAGLSNLDLARLIAKRLNAAQQGKLWRLVIETLGDDAETDDEQRFDVESASNALIFVRAKDVPAPDVSANISTLVTNVRFCSNINFACASLSLMTKSVLGYSIPAP